MVWRSGVVVLLMLVSFATQAQKQMQRMVEWPEQPDATEIYQITGVTSFRIENFVNRGDSLRPSSVKRFVTVRPDGKISVDSLSNRKSYADHYFYNETGKLLSEERRYADRKRQTKYKFLSNVLVIGEDQYNSDGEKRWRYVYDYDDAGQMISMLQQRPQSDDTIKYITFQWNQDGQLVSKSDMAFKGNFNYTYEYQYEYDGQGRWLKESLVIGEELEPVRTWEWDQNGNCAFLDYQKKRGIHYEYGENGLLWRKTYYDDRGEKTGYSQYIYDFER